MFSQVLVEDLVLPEKAVVPIANSIHTQIEKYRAEILGHSNLTTHEDNNFIPTPTEEHLSTEECLCKIQVGYLSLWVH